MAKRVAKDQRKLAALLQASHVALDLDLDLPYPFCSSSSRSLERMVEPPLKNDVFIDSDYEEESRR